MSAKRSAAATLLFALAGLAISGVIASVHANLARSPSYVSFCNVNDVVSCDVVLSSQYAYVFGVPIAWWALLTYSALAVAALFVWSSDRASRRRQVSALLLTAAVASLVFSVYLAWIALGVLHALCLLCSGLYLVNAGLLISTWLLYAAVRAEGRAAGKRGPVRGETRMILAAVAVLLVAFAAFSLWEVSGRNSPVTAEQVEKKDPEFYRWYNALPVSSDIPTQGGHRKGEGSQVVIVEFSDFECGHCARAFRSLKQVLPRFGKDVTVIFHHFPLDQACNPSVNGSFHRYACLAAVASECAAQQDHFWQYHDLLFENQSSLDRDSLIRYAEDLGLDRSEFVHCLESDAPRERVRSDVSEGERLGVHSTPTFLINGRVVAGALDPDKLELAIRLERARARAG